MMESVPQSEEMLAELLGDGKVSPEEYERLLKALRAKKSGATKRVAPPCDFVAEERASGAFECRPPLRLSRYNRLFEGVCAGLAEHFNLDPWLVRAIFLILIPISGGLPVLLLYAALTFFVPREEPRPEMEPWNQEERRSLIYLLILVGAPQILIFGALKFLTRSAYFFSGLEGYLSLLTRLAFAHSRFLDRYPFISIVLDLAFMCALVGVHLFLEKARSRAILRFTAAGVQLLYLIVLALGFLLTLPIIVNPPPGMIK